MDTGWQSPATVTEIADGDDSWTSPSNAVGSSNTYARCETDVGNISNTLRFLFALSLPADTVPIGIEVRYEAKSDLAENTRGYLTSLVKAGVTSGNNKFDTAFLPEADTLYTKGGATDMWGLSLTRADVNAVNFGFDLKFEATSDAAMTLVDYGQIKVHYAEVTYGTGDAMLPGLTGKAHHRVN